MIPVGVQVEIRPEALTGGGEVEMLRCYVPDLMRDVIEPLRRRGIDSESIAWLGSYGQGNDLLPLLGMPQDALNVTDADREAARQRVQASRDETS
jgi:hypothetical protein